MSVWQVSSAVMTVVLLSVGQILFKRAAESIDITTHGWLQGLLFNPWLLSGLMIYVGATALWLYVLRILPLSVAYPFVALAFFLVPLLSWYFLDEQIGWNTLMGATLIFAGVWISNL